MRAFWTCSVPGVGMIEVVTGVLMLFGSGFALISALGILRMPDVYIRMHAATKAGTLGAGLMLLALAVFFGDLGLMVEALSVVTFLLLSAPVAAHAIGRSAYLGGVPLWEDTQFDDYAAYAETVKSPGSLETRSLETRSQKGV